MNADPAEIFEQTIQKVEEFYQKSGEGQTPPLQPLKSQAEQFLETATSFSNPLLALSRKPYKEGGLYRHVVHVALHSLALGQTLKFKPEKLSTLCLAGLLFDIGMMKIKGHEMSQIKEHPKIGASMLEKYPELPPEVIRAALQHHERNDGSGYPNGLKEKEIEPMARIVGLADTFCNLSHVAPQQRSLSLHETMQELLHGKKLFDEKYLRALLENVTFYPKGTWLKLSTGEIGMVVRENLGAPLGPVVKIYCDADGERLEEERFVDLKTTPITIKEVLPEEKLKQKGIDTQWS